VVTDLILREALNDLVIVNAVVSRDFFLRVVFEIIPVRLGVRSPVSVGGPVDHQRFRAYFPARTAAAPEG
jgi:hypothetical protein